MRYLEPDIGADIDDAIGKCGIAMRIDARQRGSDLVRHALCSVPDDGYRHVGIEAYLREHIGQPRFAGYNIAGAPETVAAADQVMHGQAIVPDTRGRKQPVELQTDAG